MGTLLQQVRHPFVLDVEATIETEAHVCVITELLDGGDLFDMMHRIKRRFTQEESIFLAGSIIVALEALHHRSIVHRDIKPENVMFDALGNVRLIDLGLGKNISEDGKTFTVIGTPMYMAPEIFKKRGYNTRVDFWSLGMILYDLVCACLPFGLKGNEETTRIVKATRKAALNFPAHYQDTVGQNLLQGLLATHPHERFTCCDLKHHVFFETRGPENFFENLTQWEVESPFKFTIAKTDESQACLSHCSTGVSQLTEESCSSAQSSDVQF